MTVASYAVETLATAANVVLRQIGPLRRTIAALLLVVTFVSAILFALSSFTNTPMALLTRDMAATTGAKFYIGLLSGLGALLWSAAAAVSLFGAVALSRFTHQRECAGFLFGMSLLLAALGADDFFMLHEVVYPKIGLEEQWLVLIYGFGMAALMVRFRQVLLDSELLLLVGGALLFLASVLVDAFARGATATEDILKFAGICFWLSYVWRLSLQQLCVGAIPARERSDRTAPRNERDQA